MIDRAKQFSPFSPLKGFYSKILDKEKIIVTRHEILEDKASDLSYRINQVEKGMMIKVIYYLDNEYIKKEGIVSKIDFDTKKLTVVKEEIFFDDIWEIDSDEKNLEKLF